MNRLTSAIEDVRGRVAALDADKRAELDAAMDVEFEEHFRYQEIQAHAHVEQTLSTEEAQVIYVALGEVGSPANGGWAADTDLATKVVVTQLMGELLQQRLARR